MSHNLWKFASVPVIAMVIVIFAVGRTTGELATAANLPAGTHWNLNAGYGDSELKLLQAGKYTSGGVGAVSVEGAYSVSEDQVVFIESGPADAPCLHIPGRYQWSMSHKVLTLKAVEDPCPTRQVDWASGEWISKP